MIRITEDKMTTHPGGITATRVASIDGWQQWVLSWMPDRTVGRNEATTGMVLAELVLAADAAGRQLDAKEQLHGQGLAAELSLPLDVAARLIRAAAAGPVADVAELRAAFGEPVEGRDFFTVAPHEPITDSRSDTEPPRWDTLRPRDFGLAERHVQTAMLIQTDPGTLF